MLYNALWYYPVLMLGGACATVFWDYGWGQRAFQAVKARMSRRKDAPISGDEERPQTLDLQGTLHGESDQNVDLPNTAASRQSISSNTERHRHVISTAGDHKPMQNSETSQESIVSPESRMPTFSWRFGLTVIVCFFITFIAVMTLRGTLHSPPRGFSLFANLYLAGTIIFGGGPVVIPLLREFVVAEGWVSARDFLLGLAIIQAFPGPNFNFAVYLATLAAVGDPSHLNPAAGAVIGYIAIFTPGLTLHTGTMGGWTALRRYRWATSVIRGVSAVAVGLVYAAVYRLWEIGYVGADFKTGSPLGDDPWWVVVTVTSFVGGQWFGVSAPVAILLGGAMGMVWYGIVST